MACGYEWGDEDNACEPPDLIEHSCILQDDDGHTEHECACGESQAEE